MLDASADCFVNDCACNYVYVMIMIENGIVTFKINKLVTFCFVKIQYKTNNILMFIPHFCWVFGWNNVKCL